MGISVNAYLSNWFWYLTLGIVRIISSYKFPVYIWISRLQWTQLLSDEFLINHSFCDIFGCSIIINYETDYSNPLSLPWDAGMCLSSNVWGHHVLWVVLLKTNKTNVDSACHIISFLSGCASILRNSLWDSRRFWWRLLPSSAWSPYWVRK